MIRKLVMAGTGALALLLANSFAPPAVAASEGWSVVPAPSDDEPFDAASVTNEAGDNLIVWSRNVDGHVQVFAELHPAEGIKLAKAMPVYRIDDGNPVDTDEIRIRGDSQNAMWGLTTERTSFWLLLDSTKPVVMPADPLHAWFVGQELHLSVMTHDGSMREMTFPLAGSAAAIRKATGVRTE
ncbi:MAG TPA: hypothetical protein VHA10_19350 [Hypericibacter adhaerens]|uniref:Copper chaperone PCu(A)C n=1 Tax=Hypericibacter adhaerens TaxID=2602016 RepID=A0A5J6MYG7_9PROT|nr:hypothetical protein [Hypericibacter adhaerens]QEX22629.1 hypothetical protein FRZ61_25610 [Hypericibacter adhaerens]HWA45387.1 hypothetical protein [Hypericibacter adhaerens]